jgi:pimeloyl-ACP methyl ester carboxylesterase
MHRKLAWIARSRGRWSWQHPEQDAGADHELLAAQEALIARDAPGTRIRRVRWSQGETQVLEIGTGPPLLLVHGGLSSAVEWFPVLHLLARSHRVLALDRPGHGLADSFDYSGVDLFDHASTFLRDMVDALQLRTVDVVANSMGGLWSAVFAVREPMRVSRLILAGAPAGLKRKVPPQLRVLGLPWLGAVLGRLLMSHWTRERCRKFWGQILVANPQLLDDALLDAVLVNARRNIKSHLSFIGSVLDVGGLRRPLILGERWQQIRIPTACLWGDRDAFSPPEEGDALAARNPNFRIVRIPGAGHLPWIDEPDLVVAEIERFLVS